ncbi:MAG: helix-turn-helix domain-containing protein [Clostridia bacterium]|nr:helix-turn-helix domain-containing protein [Clostridia bacterium]
MFVRYLAGRGEEYLWEEKTPAVFRRVDHAPYYQKCVYLYPSENEQPPLWLWVAGYEKASPTKAAVNRVWRTRLVLHFCVRGKGTYNGEPITAGTAFLSWPMLPHTMLADPDDPFEYYWVMIRGENIVPFVKGMGFSPDRLVFPCDYITEVVPLLKHFILEVDHSKIDLQEYTDAMLRMIFSCQKSIFESNREKQKGVSQCYNDYVNLSKHYLHDTNYSISIQKLAQMLSISPKHLNYVFKKVTGISPKQYITERRMGLAKSLLNDGMLPTEVSKVLKYSDYVMFYRAFIKQYGIPPTAYHTGKEL